MKLTLVKSLAFSASFGLATLSQAASFAIGTSAQGSATYGIGAAIAKVASENTGDQYTVQPYGGTGKVVPLVNAARADFGLANILEVTNAVYGRGPFKDRSNENLRIVGVIYPFEVGFFVKSNSPAKTVNDIKGLRISSEYNSQKIIGVLTKAVMANAGISMDEMEPVPTAGIISNADDFAAGRTDVGFFAVGAGKVNAVDASVGGIRFLSINDDAESVARMQAVIPQTYVEVAQPASHKTGVEGTTNLMAYDYILYAGAHVSDESVASLVETMVENREALASNYASFEGLDPAKMSKDVNMPYHPGAEAYYKQNGLWAQ
jgi:TRAP transporter TAXI family solute receptor